MSSPTPGGPLLSFLAYFVTIVAMAAVGMTSSLSAITGQLHTLP